MFELFGGWGNRSLHIFSSIIQGSIPTSKNYLVALRTTIIMYSCLPIHEDVVP